MTLSVEYKPVQTDNIRLSKGEVQVLEHLGEIEAADTFNHHY